MCYDPLVEGDADQPVTAMLRAELAAAVRNGAVAGVVVLAVLLVDGAPAWVVAASVAGALVLGTVLHQALLVAGALVVRTVDWLQGRGPTRTG